LVASEGAGIVSDARCTSELTGEEPNRDRLPARRERGRGAPGLTCSGVARARRGPGEARYRTVFRDRYMGIPANRSAWAPPSMTRQARTAGWWNTAPRSWCLPFWTALNRVPISRPRRPAPHQARARSRRPG